MNHSRFNELDCLIRIRHLLQGQILNLADFLLKTKLCRDLGSAGRQFSEISGTSEDEDGEDVDGDQSFLRLH